MSQIAAMILMFQTVVIVIKQYLLLLFSNWKIQVPRQNNGSGPSVQDDGGDEEEEGSYESCLSRLRGKHDLPEFKLRCWARMVVRKI